MEIYPTQGSSLLKQPAIYLTCRTVNVVNEVHDKRGLTWADFEVPLARFQRQQGLMGPGPIIEYRRQSQYRSIVEPYQDAHFMMRCVASPNSCCP
jgi:hypothetical protein